VASPGRPREPGRDPPAIAGRGRPLRVGMVFYTHPSFRGRAIPHVESEIAEQLVLRGHEVVAYCPVTKQGELPPWRGIRLVAVKCRTIRRPRWAVGVELPLRTARRLDPALDVLVMNGEQGAWIASLAARRHRTVSVLAIHGLIRGVIGYRSARSFRLRLRDRLLRRILSWGEMASARTADLVIPGSHRLVAELTVGLGVRPERVVAIPNGVRSRPLRTAQEREAARSELGLPADGFYVAFVGADYRRKGLAVARLAVEGARKEGVPATLLTVGSPPHRTPTEIGYGWVNESKKWQVLSAADAFLFPTQYEAYSLAVREAASIGLPILTTPQSGVDEGVAGEDYLLYDPKDVAGFTQGLVRVFRDPAWASRLGERGATAIASWTFERQGAEWDVTLRALVGRRSSAGRPGN
jgi:glycosyltransferase involved in cell wall biosynthesis